MKLNMNNLNRKNVFTPTTAAHISDTSGKLLQNINLETVSMLNYRQLLIILDVRTSSKINYNYTIMLSVTITNVLMERITKCIFHARLNKLIIK